MIQNWSNLHSSIGFVVTVFIDHIICCQARITTKLIKFAFSGSVSGKTWSWTSSWAWTTSRCTGLKPQHCPFAFRALNPQSLSFGTFNNHWCTSSFLHQPIFVIYVTQRTSLMFFVTESLVEEGSARCTAVGRPTPGRCTPWRWKLMIIMITILWSWGFHKTFVQFW